jgi:Icc-related predicted phosphoesterase
MPLKFGKSSESQLQIAAESVLAEIGAGTGLRILHVTDLHNRTAAFTAWRILTKTLSPDLTVCTGDLCGIGGPLERLLMSRWLGKFERPNVLAPGNHDSRATFDAFNAAGGVVLSAERTVDVGGCRVWGYEDPNRTKLIMGPRYDPSLCRRAARLNVDALARIEGPFLIAIHNELMVESVPDTCPLVLSGHFHSARVRREGSTLFVRSGTTGGRSKYSNAIRFAVIDCDRTNRVPNQVWLAEIQKERAKVIPAEI